MTTPILHWIAWGGVVLSAVAVATLLARLRLPWYWLIAAGVVLIIGRYLAFAPGEIASVPLPSSEYIANTYAASWGEKVLAWTLKYWGMACIGAAGVGFHRLRR